MWKELDRKGGLRGHFYLELKRKPCERSPEFCTRFRTLVVEMKQEGILLPDGELGCFLKSKLGLDPLRSQLLETALAGRESYDAVEGKVYCVYSRIYIRLTLCIGNPIWLQMVRVLCCQGFCNSLELLPPPVGHPIRALQPLQLQALAKDRYDHLLFVLVQLSESLLSLDLARRMLLSWTMRPLLRLRMVKQMKRVVLEDIKRFLWKKF